ncbi:MAG: type II secretion system protein [Patescibacteria group bacterium]
MKKTSYEFVRAFTLVELMVTVAIIALLTGIIVTNLTGSRSKARDAKRISDIGQIQLALELYFDRCKQYPQQIGGDPHISNAMLNVSNGCPAANPAIKLSSYISNIPTPPGGTSQVLYDYDVNNLSRPTSYVLHTKLENYNEVLKDSAPTHPFPGGPTSSAAPSGTGSPTTATCGAATLDYCLTP